MEKEIRVTLDKVWGNKWYYPACDFSRLICRLTKKKTITAEISRILEEAGIKIVVLKE